MTSLKAVTTGSTLLKVKITACTSRCYRSEPNTPILGLRRVILSKLKPLESRDTASNAWLMRMASGGIARGAPHAQDLTFGLGGGLEHMIAITEVSFPSCCGSACTAAAAGLARRMPVHLVGQCPWLEEAPWPPMHTGGHAVVGWALAHLHCCQGLLGAVHLGGIFT